MMDGCVGWPEEFVREYRDKGYWEDITLGEHFDKWVTQYADRIAVSYKGREVTYRRMDEYVTRVAFHMAEMGIRTYDRVILQVFNCPEFIYIFYACMKIGAIPVCTLATHRYAEISYFAKKCQARAHIIPAGTVIGFDYEEFAEEIRREIPSMKFVLAVGNPNRPGIASVNDFMKSDVDLNKAKAALARYRPDPMEPGVFQLSGGTTGVPKIIPRTHNDYYYNAKCCADAQGIDENERFLIYYPMTHNAPIVVMMLPTHLKGGTVVVCAPKSEEVLQAVEQDKVTYLFFGAPVAPVLDEEVRQNFNISSVRKIWVAGIPPELQVKVREVLKSNSVQVFGMAEGLIAITRPSDPLETKLHTQGRPVSEADEVKIVAPETREELSVGQVGEMICRGPYTLRGYYKAEERNKEAFTSEGFYISGDMCKLDEQGNLILCGRIKDCINRGGEKVNAEEVEGHILNFSKVSTVAVVAMPDKALGERICAFAVPKPGTVFTLDELRDFLLNKRRIAKFKAPERLELVDELPTTTVGKCDKKLLRNTISIILKSEGSL